MPVVAGCCLLLTRFKERGSSRISIPLLMLVPANMDAHFSCKLLAFVNLFSPHGAIWPVGWGLFNTSVVIVRMSTYAP